MKYFYLSAILFFVICPLSSNDWDEFKVKREAEYKFVSEPKITKSGDDQFTIEFETSAFCDATVVIIESSTKKIIRHLASGVLGKNAPLPFIKNSKKQKLLWNSKMIMVVML